jgi:hypothetical protein
MTQFIKLSTLLRRALQADAIVSGGLGVVMFIFAGQMTSLLGLSETILRYSGLSLLPFAALLLYLASRESLPRPAIWAVIGYNALWALDSFLLLLLGWAEPTALGYTVVIFQAIGVIGFAELEYFGLRRSEQRKLA